MSFFYLSDKPEDMQFSRIVELLRTTYWAGERAESVIRLSMEHSLCFGAFLSENGRQIAFARAITDFASTFYLCDVIVDAAYRGRGVGRALVGAIVSDERISHLRGLLATRDAHALYQPFGFCVDTERLMERKPTRNPLPRG